MTILRWALVVPAAWVAWAVALAIGLALYDFVQSFCPVEQMISGMCVAPWFRYASAAVFCIGAGLAAALILVACTLMAPTHRPRVALVVFVAGALAGLAMAIAASAFLELVTALVVGSLVTWRLRRL